MANQTVTDLHNEILFNSKKEMKCLYTTQMNLKNIMLSNKKKHAKNLQILCICLSNISGKDIKSIKTESKLMNL